MLAIETGNFFVFVYSEFVNLFSANIPVAITTTGTVK